MLVISKPHFTELKVRSDLLMHFVRHFVIIIVMQPCTWHAHHACQYNVLQLGPPSFKQLH